MGKREEELGKFGLGSNLMLSEKEKRQLKEELAASEQAAADQRSFALKLLKVEQEKQAKLWEGKEIMPFGYNILVVPTDENPYLKKISDSGLITSSEGLFKNPDSGETDILLKTIHYAVVEQVGPDVKHIRKGDEIIYNAQRLMPLPFKEMGYVILAEGQVLGVINKRENLEERFKNVKYGE